MQETFKTNIHLKIILEYLLKTFKKKHLIVLVSFKKFRKKFN